MNNRPMRNNQQTFSKRPSYSSSNGGGTYYNNSNGWNSTTKVSIPCKYHQMSGGCRNGSQCRFLHVKVRTIIISYIAYHN